METAGGVLVDDKKVSFFAGHLAGWLRCLLEGPLGLVGIEVSRTGR